MVPCGSFICVFGSHFVLIRSFRVECLCVLFYGFVVFSYFVLFFSSECFVLWCGLLPLAITGGWFISCLVQTSFVIFLFFTFDLRFRVRGI